MDKTVDISGLLRPWQTLSGGDPDVRIAIIDGAVALGHIALQGARVTLGGQVGVAPSPRVWSEHGTRIISVLMEAPGCPVVSTAPNRSATVYSIYRENVSRQLMAFGNFGDPYLRNGSLAQGENGKAVSPTGLAISAMPV